MLRSASVTSCSSADSGLSDCSTSTDPPLNADVLSRIFLNLGFTERVRLEAVCSTWCHVLRLPACYADMRSLNVADFLSNTTADYYQQVPFC